MARTTRLPSVLAAIGAAALLAGSVMIGTAVTAGAATTSLNLSSTSAGVTCDNSNPSQPVCSGRAGGDTVTLAGTGFTPGSLASDIQCNSDLHQPVILFLGNYVPISCTPLKLSQISSTGAYNPPPFAVVQGTTGPVLNNPSVYPPTCTIDPTKGKPPLPGQSGPIPGCTTSGDPATDAANFPCPPTSAQQAAGDDCVLAIGDQAGDRAVGVVLFGTETLPTTTTTGAGGTTTTAGGSTTTTGATTTTTGATTTTTGATTTTTGATTTTTGATTTTTGATTTTTGATTTTTGATTTTTGATTTTTGATTTTSGGAGTQPTGPYELYCPGSPVGNIALNDVMTVGTITPSSPSSGTQFNLTGYQTTVTLPASLAAAASALSPTLTGSANAQLDASGATPGTLPVPNLGINLTFPSPLPPNGVQLQVPSTPASEGPFTATSSGITIQQDSSTAITLIVSGAPLPLTCTAYPNNDIATSGITTSTPTGNPIAPVIAVAGGGSTTTTTVPPPKGGGTGGSGGSGGAKAVTAASSGLAFTGPGPGIAWLMLIGAGLVIFGFALLVLVDAPRRLIAQLAFVNPMRRRRARDGSKPSRRLGFTRPDIDVRAWTGHFTSGIASRGRGMGTRMTRMPDSGRELAQTTAKGMARAARWFLGR